MKTAEDPSYQPINAIRSTDTRLGTPLASIKLRFHAAHFIAKCNQRIHRKIQGVSPPAMTLLASYAWPGNVRELENVMQRMMVVARGDVFDVDDLPPEIRGNEGKALEIPAGLKQIAQQSSGIVEKRAIADALSTSGGNVTRAAHALGISRATLQTRMKRFGLRK